MHIILRIYYALSLSPCPKVTIALKRLDIIIPHERLQEVNDILHKNKVGGMTHFMTSRAEVAQNENQYQLAVV